MMMESQNHLTITFVPFDAYGHVYGCIGLGQTLLKRGHSVVFVVNQSWKGKLSSYGFDEEIYNHPTEVDDSMQLMAETAYHIGDVLKMSSFDKIRHLDVPVKTWIMENVKEINESIKNILLRVKPHVIIIDTIFAIPSALSLDIPWVHLALGNQLSYAYPGIDALPPGGSGYAIDSDRKEWKQFRDEKIKCYDDNFCEFNSWIQSKDAEPLTDPTQFCNESPFLNLYLCPEELDYDDLRPKPLKWHNIDYLMRDEYYDIQFDIPESLREKRGKLIYLSMGTIASGDITLMKRLTLILSQSPNRFIVSKGLLGNRYELPTNMWGDCMVPQTKILSLVDLVITHGGNNSVTETLLFGKPMIVMPVFADQYDNAQRIHEKKLGIRLDPYHCDSMELLNAIETLINDGELKERLTMISQRMKNSMCKDRAAELIEDLVKAKVLAKL